MLWVRRMRIDVWFDGMRDRGGSLRRRVERMFSPLSRVARGVGSARLRVLKGKRWGYRVSFEMRMPNRKVFAEERGEDLLTTIARVRDMVRRQARKYRERMRGRRRN